MKKSVAIILTALLAVACVEKDLSSDFTVSGPADLFSGEALLLTGESQTVALTVTPQVARAQWKATTPAADDWCTSYTDEATGNLMLGVTRNDTDLPRRSHLRISIGETVKSIGITQDYHKVLSFVADDNSIDASAGTYEVPVTTNLSDTEITVTVEEGAAWITSALMQDGVLLVTALRNDSGTATRRAKVTLSSGAVRGEAFVTQMALSGYPYVISLAGVNLDNYPVYELFDDVHSVKIGEICREYLYKYDALTGETLVDGVFRVAYPASGGVVDYTKGTVLDNGGKVVWNADGILLYKAGTTPAGLLLYYPAGSTTIRLQPDTGGDENIPAACRPMIVTDYRAGAADSRGNTSETFEYTAVKIGNQYWMRENFRTSRYANGAPIPTGFDNATWAGNVTGILKPMCLVSGTGSSNTYIDANDPAAVSTRNSYGCLYTYAALVSQEITLGSSAASFTKEDRISPEGWRVPFLEDFRALTGYLCQDPTLSTTDAMAVLRNKMQADMANTSGFGARGTRQRGATGGYNAITYYQTLDYSFEGGQHLVYQLRLREGNYTPLFTVTAGSGNYLRLIKQSQ